MKLFTRRKRPSLFRSIATTLAVALFAFQAVILAVVIYFVMVPMAKRSADDLAALMVLSAQTWTELPAETRHDFEHELAKKHNLWLFSANKPLSEETYFLPYLYFFKQALEKRTGLPIEIKVTQWEQPWYWADIPVSGKIIRIGFPKNHIGVRPPQALALVLGVTIVLTFVVSVILARRISRPLTRLARAAKLVGEGTSPLEIPETGTKELANLAHTFNHMAKQVKELLDNRTTLLAGISHDLRTPLARMRIAIEMLPENTNPKVTQRLQHDLEEMNRLIGEFLELSQGLGKEPQKEIDIHQLLNELVNDARISGANIEWQPHDVCKRNVGIMALKRVLSNLIENAVRYGEGKAVTITCTCEPNKVVIRIFDRGPGIPPDKIEHVFRPFYRLESSRSTVTGGTGLGLAIAKQLSEANRWIIELLPRNKGGTEARLIIPT